MNMYVWFKPLSLITLMSDIPLEEEKRACNLTDSNQQPVKSYNSSFLFEKFHSSFERLILGQGFFFKAVQGV